MYKIRTYIAFLSIIHLVGTAWAQGTTAKDVIEGFYRSYLSYLNDPEHLQQPKLEFSKAFQRLVDEDARVCREKAKETCGWDADGDVYLDTQDYDPHITFENSGATITELAPGKVQAKFNIYPSDKNGGENRVMVFHMIQENGKWVVDDIISRFNSSARKVIQDEIDSYWTPHIR